MVSPFLWLGYVRPSPCPVRPIRMSASEANRVANSQSLPAAIGGHVEKVVGVRETFGASAHMSNMYGKRRRRGGRKRSGHAPRHRCIGHFPCLHLSLIPIVVFDRRDLVVVRDLKVVIEVAPMRTGRSIPFSPSASSLGSGARDTSRTSCRSRSAISADSARLFDIDRRSTTQ